MTCMSITDTIWTTKSPTQLVRASCWLGGMNLCGKWPQKHRKSCRYVTVAGAQSSCQHCCSTVQAGYVNGKSNKPIKTKIINWSGHDQHTQCVNWKLKGCSPTTHICSHSETSQTSHNSVECAHAARCLLCYVWRGVKFRLWGIDSSQE